ncbi:MAG: apolipoprotein N-acyltransferase [Acidobacteriota bacterium]|nr:apolipoprotein N-acyltransferase [Acidobacteriota bacterium]
MLFGLLTAVLLILIFPGFGVTALAPIALIPVLYAAAREPRPLRRFLIGYLTGSIYWFGVCYWIQSTLEQHGGMGAVTSWALFTLFCLAKAIQTGLFTWAVRYFQRGWWAAPALAALWTVFEWSHNYTGFAWLVLGNAAIDWPLLAKLAPFTGVWGISFALALVSAAVVRRQWAWLLPVAAVALLPAPGLSPATKTALAIQPNISDEFAWSEEPVAELRRHLAQLSTPYSGAHLAPDIVVWPEVPAPIYDSDRFLSDVARAAAAPLLAGVVSHTDWGAPLNSALLLSRDGQFISRYDKVNLVPFGEFVPWPFNAVARKVSTEAGEFAPGARAVVARNVGTFICYESVFPNYIRQFPLHGATVLFNISNDSWFGRSAARHQHFAIARMRAVENRRWLVRVTNNGITASIDPGGKVHNQQPSYKEVAALLPYGEDRGITPYTQWGDWFILLCVFIILTAVLPRRSKYPGSPDLPDGNAGPRRARPAAVP